MIKLKDVVELVQSERVLLKEARAGIRLACLVVNRAGRDKADLAMAANALESLEKLVNAIDMGAIGSIIHYAICLDTRRRSLEGVPCTQQWAETADECGFKYDSPLHKALAELIPQRIEARRAATPVGERWTFAPTGDDVLAALEAAKAHGANETQLVAVFRAVMPMLELATVIRGYESELMFARIARPLVDAGAPEVQAGETPGLGIEAPGITEEICGETVPLGEVGEVAADETPAAADPPSETPAD